MPTKLWFWRSVAACFLFSLLILPHTAFQSDELLQDDDDEFDGARRIRRSDLDPAPSPDSKSSVQFALEHSFGDSGFFSAGTFSARLKSWNHGGQTLTKLRLSRNTLSGPEKDGFERLLRDDGFYRIRVPSNVLHSSAKEYIV